MHKVVIGLGFGDEGKGSVVDYLVKQHYLISSQPIIVVRFSGGQQAGHTVFTNNKNHIFSNFGSGTLRHAPTYWSKYCTFDPVSFLNEYEDLKSISITPKIFVDAECPVTTPFEKFLNRTIENKKHGTCGLGVGPTFARENLFRLQVGDLFFPKILKVKIDLLAKHYAKDYHLEDFIDWEYKVKNFLLSCEQVISRMELVQQYTFFPKIKEKFTIVFEGSQGLLLDQNIGFFPHVTRSNTGLNNVQKLLGPQTPLDVYFVTRSYLTRHGNGPMVYENEIKIHDDPYEINVHDSLRGEFRKSILSVDLINYALSKQAKYLSNNSKNLVVTHMDSFDEFPLIVKDEISYTDASQFVSNLIKEINIPFDKVIVNNSRFSQTFKTF